MHWAPSALEIARDRDLAVHQRFHDPADHLVEDPDMFLVSRPSKRFSTSSSFMLSVREMSSSLEKSRMRKW